MDDSTRNLLNCKVCNNPVREDDEFCPECGVLFIHDFHCDEHKDIPAEGVCIICIIPYCGRCGAKINNHFLCNQHSGYEIYEGMTRVYGTLDDLNAQYVKTCFEKNGLHPFLFCRQQPEGGARFVSSLFEANGDYLGNIVNETKVMVPCQEVLKAEEILQSINIAK